MNIAIAIVVNIYYHCHVMISIDCIVIHIHVTILTSILLFIVIKSGVVVNKLHILIPIIAVHVQVSNDIRSPAPH